MDFAILAGCANPSLALGIAQQLGVELMQREISRFPDGELHIELQGTVRGRDVYIIQPTSPPADARLFELFFLADACRRAGSARLTAIIPYFGYARQDRRATGREPVSGRLVASLIEACGIDRVVAVDLHIASLEGFFGLPLEHLSAVAQLGRCAQAWLPSECEGIVVSPDLGAAKLADRYAGVLNLPVAIVHKQRLSGEEVKVRHVVGEVRGRAPVIVDDMISTAGTIEAAAKALLDAGCHAAITVIATHGLLVGQAVARLSALPLRRLVVTDSVVVPTEHSLPLEQVSLAPLFGEAIRRLYREESLGDLLVHE